MPTRVGRKEQQTHYGYKDHVKVDKEYKLIVDYSVTDVRRKKAGKNKIVTYSTDRENKT